MVRAVYEIEKERFEDEVVDTSFLLTNKLGGYFLDFKPTKYRGLFLAEKRGDDWTLVKSVDTISINSVPTEIINRLWSVEKVYGKAVEKFFTYKNTLLYEVENYDGTAILTLDFREIHDFDINGKKYSISEEDGFLIIKFTKGDFTRFLAIKTGAPYTKLNKWTENQFEFDKRRKDTSQWYVYDALAFKISGNATLSISFSDSKEKAKNEANYVYFAHSHLKSEKKSSITKASLQKNINEEKYKFAYHCSLKALDDLVANINGMTGIYAGLPWFFQVWSRDEAISLGAFIKEKQDDFVKKTILRQTEKILPDGRIPNRMPNSDLGSADGVGWVFKRFNELFDAVRNERKLNNHFSDAELLTIRSRIKDSLEKIFKNYVQHNMTVNRRKETWMDTDEGNDPRDGARIEIQALTLSMLRCAKEVCKHLYDPDHKRFEKMEIEMRAQVKKLFLQGDLLNDGYNDATIRPNVFLAYYIYPELLHRKEWKAVFDKALEALWLPWGGLATIDKKSPLFCDEYTGMQNKSYHRGDSWYWINNLAAICMHKVDKDHFAFYIKKILEASTEEILRMGALGCHAEVSSAKEQRSEGTISQAWSSAMYVEMIHELFK